MAPVIAHNDGLSNANRKRHNATMSRTPPDRRRLSPAVLLALGLTDCDAAAPPAHPCLSILAPEVPDPPPAETPPPEPPRVKPAVDGEPAVTAPPPKTPPSPFQPLKMTPCLSVAPPREEPAEHTVGPDQPIHPCLSLVPDNLPEDPEEPQGALKTPTPRGEALRRVAARLPADVRAKLEKKA